MWAVQSILKRRTGGVLISIFLGGNTISSASDLYKVANNDVISIAHDKARLNSAMSASKFESRWGETQDDLVLDAKGVIHPNIPKSTIPQKITFLAPAGSDSKIPGPLRFYLQAPRVASNHDANVAECGPSPLTTDEIQALVKETAKEFGVDENFVLAITNIESGFDQIRSSPEGARGPMQLIPATAERFKVADVCDPAQNIKGGVKYLRALFDEFSNPMIVAAAYNSGESRIYEYGGIPPFDETLNYVAKVMNYQLGVDLPKARRRAADVKEKGRETHITQDEGSRPGVAHPRKGEWVAGVLQF